MSDEKKVTFDQEVPESAAKTAQRLFGQLKNQRLRLIFVGICIVCYVILNVYTPRIISFKIHRYMYLG